MERPPWETEEEAEAAPLSVGQDADKDMQDEDRGDSTGGVINHREHPRNLSRF